MAKVWSYPEINDIVKALGSNRDRMLAALECFDEKGLRGLGSLERYPYQEVKRLVS